MDDSYRKEFNRSRDHFGGEHLKKGNSSGSDSSKDIKKAVEECLSSSSTLEVSRKNIERLMEEMCRPPNIKYLYLEGNVISMIPKDFFFTSCHVLFDWISGITRLKLFLLELVKIIGHRVDVMIKASPGQAKKLPQLWKRQLKTLLLEGNPIKELPVELGNLTSLRALNLRHCPLEFPPKDVIKRGLKSILCSLWDSENGKLLWTGPAASVEMPPVEKLNLSKLLQSSLHLSEEWPNEKEKLRFQKHKERIIVDEKEEFLADEQSMILLKQGKTPGRTNGSTWDQLIWAGD